MFRSLAPISGLALALTCTWAAAAEPNAGSAEQGKETYAQYCETCHGRDLAAASPLVFDLRKFPKNDAERFRNAVLNGKGGMPPWRGTLNDQDINDLWAYVRRGE